MIGPLYPRDAPDARTEAERRFDALVAERRAAGRRTYGQGLEHRDGYHWPTMALEEALDLGQYLAADNLRLREALRRLGHHEPACRLHKGDPAYCSCGLEAALR